MIVIHLGVMPKLMFFLYMGFASFGLLQTQMAFGSEHFTRLDMGMGALRSERWETER